MPSDQGRRRDRAEDEPREDVREILPEDSGPLDQSQQPSIFQGPPSGPPSEEVGGDENLENGGFPPQSSSELSSTSDENWRDRDDIVSDADTREDLQPIRQAQPSQQPPQRPPESQSLTGNHTTPWYKASNNLKVLFYVGAISVLLVLLALLVKELSIDPAANSVAEVDQASSRLTAAKEPEQKTLNPIELQPITLPSSIGKERSAVEIAQGIERKARVLSNQLKVHAKTREDLFRAAALEKDQLAVSQRYQGGATPTESLTQALRSAVAAAQAETAKLRTELAKAESEILAELVQLKKDLGTLAEIRSKRAEEYQLILGDKEQVAVLLLKLRSPEVSELKSFGDSTQLSKLAAQLSAARQELEAQALRLTQQEHAKKEVYHLVHNLYVNHEKIVLTIEHAVLDFTIRAK